MDKKFMILKYSSLKVEAFLKPSVMLFTKSITKTLSKTRINKTEGILNPAIIFKQHVIKKETFH